MNIIKRATNTLDSFFKQTTFNHLNFNTMNNNSLYNGAENQKNNTMTEILDELKSRGEYSIKFLPDGTITSRNGRVMFNTWIIDEKRELKCIESKNIY